MALGDECFRDQVELLTKHAREELKESLAKTFKINLQDT